MSKESNIKEFPDISNKLSAPTKKSAYERQKAEAEAKRLKEERENRAALENFVKEFEGDDDDAPAQDAGGRLDGNSAGLAARGLGGAPKRHFAASSSLRNSGPGSLGPAPPLSRKRAIDGSFTQPGPRDQGLFAYDNPATKPIDAATAFQASDDEDEAAAAAQSVESIIPRPTLQLSSLPLNTTSASVKALIPKYLNVEKVQIVTPPKSDRASLSALVTVAANTPASDLDKAVNELQQRYLGFGYYLTLSRHLSSSVWNGSGTGFLSSASSALPFGAKPVTKEPGPAHLLSRAPPPDSLRSGAPYPPAYGFGMQGPPKQPPLQVSVVPPSDIRELRLIHKTVEALLENGPEFEALLMSRPEVQHEEKWAWIWDSRSVGGIWYRWRIWEIKSGREDGSGKRNRQSAPVQMFDGAAIWQPPEEKLKFEFATNFDDLPSDPDYSSDDGEDSGIEGQRRRHNNAGAPPEAGFGMQKTEKGYLNPLQKAELTYYLARLPNTIGTLLGKDVARVTYFAISRAAQGVNEVVDMLVTNIERPFCRTSAKPATVPEEDEAEYDEEKQKELKEEREDPSSPKLIGLYLVSDILSASLTSGQKSWRYRQAFETAFRERKVFEGLGRLDKDLGWGRMKAEKWKRSVGVILANWGKWDFFTSEAHQYFVDMFNNPPLTKAEKDAQEKAEEEAKRAKTTSKWKAVEARPEPKVNTTPIGGLDGANDDDDGTEPMEEDARDESKDSVTGRASEPTAQAEVPQKQADAPTISLTGSAIKIPAGETEAARARRRRPKAEDMFADSD